MKYLNKSFSVAMPNVEQDVWDSIFAPHKAESKPKRVITYLKKITKAEYFDKHRYNPCKSVEPEEMV